MNKKNIFYNQNSKYKLIEKQRNDLILFDNIMKAKSNLNNNFNKKDTIIKKTKYKNNIKNQKILKENNILFQKICKINNRKVSNSKSRNKTISKFNFNQKVKNDEIHEKNIKLLKNLQIQKPTVPLNKTQVKIKSSKSIRRIFSNKKIVYENKVLLKKSIKYKNEYYYIEVSSNIIENEENINLLIETEEINFNRKFSKKEWENNVNEDNINDFIFKIIDDFEEENSKEEEMINEYKNKLKK